MKKRIQSYMHQVDALLRDADPCKDWEAVRQEHLTQLSFYQHERLVHLLVTMLVAILMLLSIGIALIAAYPYMLLASAGLFALLFPYIMHYFFLENAVQAMYIQYDKICKHIND